MIERKGMEYLYIIYKTSIPENLCELYTGRWDTQNKKYPPSQENKIRYHF